MPINRATFSIVQENLQNIIDVDDSAGRSVPINMNFVDEGSITKDTGVALFGATDTLLRHSLFYYKKKNGTSYIVSATDTNLQYYNTVTGLSVNISTGNTVNAEFGFVVYNDELYGGNAVQSLFKWDGTTVTTYASAPKGNILEIFEDRLFISGVTLEPLSIYYSDTGALSTFAVASVLKPLGVDSVTALENYFGSLLIFKSQTIWKMTFNYDAVTNLYIPKLDIQSGNYGACSRKAVSWVENDIWFFTGREVRAIGFTDNVSGVFGINNSVISDSIKETLATMSITNYSKVVCYYNNRRFYLGVVLTGSTVETVFVCHLLYKNSWTKYTGRNKAKVNDFLAIDGVMYSSTNVTSFGILKWNSTLNDISTAITSEVFFRRIEDNEFNQFRLYRYCDLMFKDLTGIVTVTIRQEASDVLTLKKNSFFVGNALEDGSRALGEVPFGRSLWGDAYGVDILTSPFIKKRVSFLSKAQAITIGLSNARVSETFSISQLVIKGYEQSKKMFSGKKIISIR